MNGLLFINEKEEFLIYVTDWTFYFQFPVVKIKVLPLKTARKLKYSPEGLVSTYMN